jgi:glycosyltransferase involved in cell wall biosynthesis
MISILIPTYNYNCTTLVSELQSQCERAAIPYEIIVADDASSNDATVTANMSISSLNHCTFYREPHNMGRAAIRNEMADRATQPYLLFIDCDAEVISPDFIQNYLKQLPQATVVCGGLRNVKKLPSTVCSLRFRYERDADKHRNAAQRQACPYSHFTTFNFLILRETFQSIRFDEKCTEYGYEDALFGLRLKEKHIPVLHIENPLIHLGLETNEVFLRKSETALRTLHHLGGDLQQFARVSNVAQRIRRHHLVWCVNLFDRLFSAVIRNNLIGSHPSLFLFKMHKLAYYLALDKE